MQTVGTTLQAMRIRRGLTIEELAKRTRIPRRIVECLERDDFKALPAPVYVKGFIRGVSRELGYDGLDVVQAYEAVTHERMMDAPTHAPMLTLHTQAPEHQSTAPAQGLRMAHAVLLFVAALTFLAAILTAAFREDKVPTQRPGAAIRVDDGASTASVSPDARR